MIADGHSGNKETLFNEQIDNLYNSLNKDDILRSINIIDSIGNNKNVLAIEPLTILLNYPDGLIRSHAAQALDKLKDATVVEPIIKLPEDQPGPAKETPGLSAGKTDEKSAIEPVDNRVAPADKNLLEGVARSQENKGPGKRSLKRITLTGIAIVVVAIMVISAGAFVYTILMPPVWTEQLQYKNSTGQYQSIIIYRNATDVAYDDVLDFIGSEKASIEAAIAADTRERPVEYAVQLHDKAEEQGINCSVLATKISNGFPGQVFIAFKTTDRGMFYVDPTARNVSAGDYPGIDFDKITLMRDTWVQDAGFLDGNNNEVYVTVYRDSVPVSYDMLIDFLADDQTEDTTYVDPIYTCANFATNLFNRSESKGIKCGLVMVTFDGQPIGHAFNAFPTTDNGIVYIDDTGLIASQKESNMSEFQTDAVVYVDEGKPLGKLNLSQVDGHLDYSFYTEKKKIIDEFFVQLKKYEADVETHNKAIDKYEADVDEYMTAVNEFNTKMNAHNAAINQFNAEEAIKYSQYLSGAITYAAYSSWFNANSGKAPPAPTNGNQLDTWQARLDSDRTRLNSELVPLNQRYATLLDSEGCYWAVYSYWQPPEGVVNNIEYVW